MLQLGMFFLVEPVPELFNRLKNLYGHNPNIEFLQAAISTEDASQVPFYALKSEANEIDPNADQLGSLNPNHAKSHNNLLASTTEIKVLTLTFESLLIKYGITYIDTLFTDTEGYDARILCSFPFLKFRPRQIIFEYKHSDGVFKIGRMLANLLLLLENFGFEIKVLDAENCLATRLD